MELTLAEILNYAWVVLGTVLGFIIRLIWDLNKRMDNKATIQEVDKQINSLKQDIVHITDLINSTARETDAKLNQLMISLIEKKQ